jgi:hypothetical protein
MQHAVLLTEDGARLLTEDGLHHLLIEPVSVELGFPPRPIGIAVIYKKADFWEVDLGQGAVRSEYPLRLEEMAKKSGASRVEYVI